MSVNKVYSANEVEKRIYDFWLSSNLFLPSDTGTDAKETFSIVIPPPNVTGVLHMGHALNCTVQDIYIRYQRLLGKKVLWVPGTDHAGIATQNVVERSLKKEGISRKDIGREKFIEKVWDWRKKHGDIIIEQLKRLGASCDWSRQKFTMDDDLSEAVNETFVRLYQDNLIYRGFYIINWCPRCQTALSDEESEHQDQETFLTHIIYSVCNQEGRNLEKKMIVATTRPETLLGDTAVAIHPEDERYLDLHGQYVRLPFVNRLIPIICDEHVAQDFGTGVVKVTPAHDVNDFEIGKRHGLPTINIMTKSACIEGTNTEFDGLDRFEARQRIVEVLKNQGFINKIEPYQNSVGHCYRCHTMIESRLSRQWFVHMKPLANQVLEMKNEVYFYPRRWTKVYEQWMNSIRDWCISRQIWWGHRIPVWYCVDCLENIPSEEEISLYEEEGSDLFERSEPILSKEYPHSCEKGHTRSFVQERDVLDTWFSSWLWPLSTLGWPQSKNQDLQTFYPTQLICTAPEILFFWVSRMIMSGVYFKKQLPFNHVFLHGTVRDDTGRKMSKSLGNTIDPLKIIDLYGADALRLSLLLISGVGQDIYLSEKKFEIGRNFLNKLWNVFRYISMHLTEGKVYTQESINRSNHLENWIDSRLNQMIEEMHSGLEAYRVNDVAKSLYDFVWHDFCDWYIEVSKEHILKESSQTHLLHIFEKILLLLHPFIPFITEEIWQELPITKEVSSLSLKSFPQSNKENYEVIDQFKVFQELVMGIRSIRKQFNLPPKVKIDLLIVCDNSNVLDSLFLFSNEIKRLLRVQKFECTQDLKEPEGATSYISKFYKAYVPLKGIVDLEEECLKLKKKEEELRKNLKQVEAKLSNDRFISKAPEVIINKEKQKKEDMKQMLIQIEKQYAVLSKSSS